MAGLAATFRFDDLFIGQQAAFEVGICADDVDAFARLSGDANPLHLEQRFATARGFRDRVVHGGFLVGLVSRLVGMQLPGENCLLLDIQMKFLAPTYPGTKVRVAGVIDQLSPAIQAAIIKVSITDLDSGTELGRGKATVRLTAAPAA